MKPANNKGLLRQALGAVLIMSETCKHAQNGVNNFPGAPRRKFQQIYKGRFLLKAKIIDRWNQWVAAYHLKSRPAGKKNINNNNTIGKEMMGK